MSLWADSPPATLLLFFCCVFWFARPSEGRGDGSFAQTHGVFSYLLKTNCRINVDVPSAEVLLDFEEPAHGSTDGFVTQVQPIFSACRIVILIMRNMWAQYVDNEWLCCIEPNSTRLHIYLFSNPASEKTQIPTTCKLKCLWIILIFCYKFLFVILNLTMNFLNLIK